MNGLLRTYPKVDLLGVGIAQLRMEELLDLCQEHIDKRVSLLLGVVNVAKIVHSQKNLELRKSLDEADLILADGLPIVWLSRLIGNPLPERVAGIDIMFRLLEKASDKGYRVYFLGAKPQVIKKVVQIVRQDYPGLHIAGYRDGYFSQSEEAHVAQQIKNSCPDILLVAMSSPKKEKFLKAWSQFINVPLCHGVGGSLDVLAGVTKRAPLWMQKCSLEWFYRLIQEPGRMWKRYLVTNSIFMVLSLQAIFQTRVKSSNKT